MTTLLLLFLAAAVTGGLMWLGGFNKNKMGLFVAHLLLGFGCVEGAAHLLSMSDIASIEAVRSSCRMTMLLVAVILLSGIGVLSLQGNKNAVNASRFVHAGAGLAALLMVLSISRQL